MASNSAGPTARSSVQTFEGLASFGASGRPSRRRWPRSTSGTTTTGWSSPRANRLAQMRITLRFAGTSHAIVIGLPLDGDRQTDRSTPASGVPRHGSPTTRPSPGRTHRDRARDRRDPPHRRRGGGTEPVRLDPTHDHHASHHPDPAERWHGLRAGRSRRLRPAWLRRLRRLRRLRAHQRGPGGRGFGGGAIDERIGDAITVASNDGTTLGLETADGWTRTIDTSNVVLTRDGVTITASDILVGERVRVAQTRNADGSYTVTGIEVQPSIVTGTVGSSSATGFTVVASDGTTTTVTVDDQTTWAAPGSTSASLADATAGRSVAVAGALQADGSIVATAVRLG